MKIEPINEAGDCRTGNLSRLTAKDITAILGFKPNVKDDPSKVKYSWGFTVDGVRCGVWDYKGSYKAKSWSTYGPASALEKVFGNRFST
jgi:hypothetical protein